MPADDTGKTFQRFQTLDLQDYSENPLNGIKLLDAPLAPEEPDVYSLQRYTHTRAPEERNELK